ncbi:MAG: iron ABC transporter permease [Bdellovibrionota bacterium]
MYWVVILILAVALLGPMAGLFAHVDKAAFIETMQSAQFLKALNITLLSSCGGAVFSLIIAILLARSFATHEWKLKRLQRLIILIPYLVPNFILATAYVIAWNPVTGLLNGVMPFPSRLYGLYGMTIVFGIAHAPLAFLLLEDKFKRIDNSLREAAKLSGANQTTILAKIELPLLKPTILSAFGLCFALNISAFAIPAWIGAPERAYTLTYKIYQVLQVGGSDGLPRASVFSIVLFLLSIPPLLVTGWIQRREQMFTTLSGKAAKTGGESWSKRGFMLFQIFFWVTQTFFWIAPLLCLAASTLVKPGCLQTSGISCFNDMSLKSYSYVLFDLSETHAAFWGSIVYGTLSAAIIMFVAVTTIICFSNRPLHLKTAEWLFSLPVATPGAIIALGLIVSCSGKYGLNIYNTPYIAVAAYVIKHINLAFQPLRTGYATVSRSIFEAARISGASPARVWRDIMLPILRPEVLGGFFLVLIPILGELTMSIFLTSPSFKSIGTVLFDLQDYADQSSAAALSIVLVILVLATNKLAHFLSKGKLGY